MIDDEVKEDEFSEYNHEFQEEGEEGGMWRTYKLQCEEMTCLIHEEFHEDAWELW